MTSPSGLLAALRSAGFSVRIDSGALWVKPASQLTKELRQQISQHKSDLLALLAAEQCPLTDEQIDALAERAYHDPPIWEPGAVQVPSVLVNVFGQWWALSATTMAAVHQMAEVACQQREQERESHRKNKTTRKKDQR